MTRRGILGLFGLAPLAGLAQFAEGAVVPASPMQVAGGQSEQISWVFDSSLDAVPFDEPGTDYLFGIGPNSIQRCCVCPRDVGGCNSAQRAIDDPLSNGGALPGRMGGDEFVEDRRDAGVNPEQGAEGSRAVALHVCSPKAPSYHYPAEAAS